MRHRFRKGFLGVSAAMHAAPFVSVVLVLPDACPEPHGARRVHPVPVMMLDRPLDLEALLPRANAANDQVDLAQTPNAVLGEEAGAAASAAPEKTRRGDQAEEKSREIVVVEHALTRPELPHGPRFPLYPEGDHAWATMEPDAQAAIETEPATGEAQAEPGESAGAAEGNHDGDDEQAHAGAPDPREEQIVAIVAKINRTVQQRVPIAYVKRPALAATGITTLQFTLHRNGAVDEMRIVTSSGRRDLEGSARRVLLMAQPFAYLSGWVEVTLAFFK